MKTTVRDFILDNLTDSNFEKLIDMLIREDLEFIGISDSINEYLNNQKPVYTKNNTFEILNEIKKVSEAYAINYKDEFIDTAMEDLNAVVEPEWLSTRREPKQYPSKLVNTDRAELNTSDADLPLDVDDELERNIFDADLPLDVDDELERDISDTVSPSSLNKSEYSSFDELKIPFICKTYEEIERNYISTNDVDTTNYQEFVHQEKNRIALGLSNFIYEILHYSNKDKLENRFDEFAHEKSHVKISEDGCVHFLLDNRTRYISNEVKEAYWFRWDCDIPVIPPKFVEFEEMWEDLTSENSYILLSFTMYLNEELIIPEVSEEALYDILEQFVYLLTYHGFTKQEQIENIIYLNTHFDSQMM